MRKDGKNRSKGNHGKEGKEEEDSSHDSPPAHPLLPPRGDYQTLLSFQKAEVVCDITFSSRRLEQDFLEQGGLRERMTRARLQYRNQPHPPQPGNP